jgi:hypothetical protein
LKAKFLVTGDINNIEVKQGGAGSLLEAEKKKDIE